VCFGFTFVPGPDDDDDDGWSSGMHGYVMMVGRPSKASQDHILGHANIKTVCYTTVHLFLVNSDHHDHHHGHDQSRI
jgi:hypothetical protein